MEQLKALWEVPGFQAGFTCGFMLMAVVSGIQLIIGGFAHSKYSKEWDIQLRDAADLDIPKPAKPTKRDRGYTAAHEAGHALVYGVLEELPANMKVVIHSASNNGVLGFVAGVEHEHVLFEKTYAEWLMLVLLAGQHGETVVHGESTLGCNGDYARWVSMAQNYLANQHGGLYYPSPQTNREQEHNRAKLEALRAKQTELVRALFDSNAEIFDTLNSTLLETSSLCRDELVTLLKDVQAPDGFPRPKIEEQADEKPMIGTKSCELNKE